MAKPNYKSSVFLLRNLDARVQRLVSNHDKKKLKGTQMCLWDVIRCEQHVMKYSLLLTQRSYQLWVFTVSAA